MESNNNTNGGEFRPKFLPATKIFHIFGLPRSLLRSLAADGTIRMTSKFLPNCEHMMHLYSVEDIERYLNDENPS